MWRKQNSSQAEVAFYAFRKETLQELVLCITYTFYKAADALIYNNQLLTNITLSAAIVGTNVFMHVVVHKQ